MEIAPNVRQIPGVNANSYLIQDADGLTLIDTGMPGSNKKIMEYLRSIGRAPGDLKRIVITHADLDHVGGLAALKEATGARIYASAIEAEAIATGKPSRSFGGMMKWVNELLGRFIKPKQAQVDEIVTDGQVLPGLGGLRVIATPGHTPGHISLFAPSAGILFCGDSLFNSSGQIRGSRPMMTWDQIKAAQSAKLEKSLAPKIVCAGHGPVVMDAASKFQV